MITEKFFVTMSEQIFNTGNQSQIQTTSVISNLNTKNTEITESIPPTEATNILPPNSYTPIKGNNIPMQVPTETIRSDLHSQTNL